MAAAALVTTAAVLKSGMEIAKIASDGFEAAPHYFKKLENLGGAKFGFPLDFINAVNTKLNPPTNYMAANTERPRWVAGAFGSIPHFAVSGGGDTYVARSPCENDLLPGKYVPKFAACFVSFRGDEYRKMSFDILCGGRTKWQYFDASNDCERIPDNAIQGGYTVAGETLFIGRVIHAGCYSVGKIHPSHYTCYIPYGTKEHKYQQCEILVLA